VIRRVDLDQTELAGVIPQPLLLRVRFPRGPTPFYQSPGPPPWGAPPHVAPNPTGPRPHPQNPPAAPRVAPHPPAPPPPPPPPRPPGQTPRGRYWPDGDLPGPDSSPDHRQGDGPRGVPADTQPSLRPAGWRGS